MGHESVLVVLVVLGQFWYIVPIATLLLVGSNSPLTVMMYGRMREGATPVLNAVSLLLMVASALLALTLLRGPKASQPSQAT